MPSHGHSQPPPEQPSDDLCAGDAGGATADVLVGAMESLMNTGAMRLRYARLSTLCSQCSGTIAPGDAMYPIERGRLGRKGSLEWLHYECAVSFGVGSLPELPLCKHYARSGRCCYAGGCFFAHPEDVGAAALEQVQSRRVDPNKKVANRGQGRRNYVKNDSRASVFRRWLLDTFGVERLMEGTGVLDVASGKGELAWELANLNRIPAVAVEPRPLELKSFRKKWSYGMYWRNPIFHAHLHCDHDPAAPTTDPRQLRLLLNPEVVSWVSAPLVGGEPELDKSGSFEAACNQARRLRWTRKGLKEHEDEDGEVDTQCPSDAEEGERTAAADLEVEEVEEAGDGIPVSSAGEAAGLIQGCSLVAALHPDQAAEYAVRLALALRKPFAVVPCCVYSAEFPRRRLDSGALVRSYEDLLQYLQALDPRIQREELDFEGKRTVIYMTVAALNGGAPADVAADSAT